MCKYAYYVTLFYCIIVIMETNMYHQNTNKNTNANVNTKFISLLWSFGEKPERSMRRNDNVAVDTIENNTGPSHSSVDNYSMNIMNTNMNTNTSISINQMGEFRKANNKRELVNSKLDERYSIGHIGQNPFNRENNYIKDLENQQRFMIPKSSYDEKI